MAVSASDIKVRLTGGASNTDKDASLGGAISTVAGGLITSGNLHNLWDLITGDEHEAGDTEYRAFGVKNEHGTDTWYGVVAWLSDVCEESGDVSVSFAIEAPVAGEIQTIANESTAPTGLSWSTATTKATGESIGDLAAAAWYGIWIKRVVTTGTTPVDNVDYTVKVEGDTAA